MYEPRGFLYEVPSFLDEGGCLASGRTDLTGLAVLREADLLGLSAAEYIYSMAPINVHQKLLPGNVYHIYNWGNNKENLFKEEANYHYFLKLWRKYIDPVADTFVYALMPNHFHFLVRVKTSQVSLSREEETCEVSALASKSFSNLFNVYSKAINKRYNRTGSLFQERFKRKLIDSESYFTEIIFYIHANPQKHKLVNDFRDYEYSSYGALHLTEPTLIQQEVLSWFGGRDKFIQYHEKYREALIEKSFFMEKENDDDKIL